MKMNLLIIKGGKMKIINICDEEIKIITNKGTEYYKLNYIDSNEGLHNINSLVCGVLTMTELLKGITMIINE